MKKLLVVALCLIAGNLLAQQWKIEYPVVEGAILIGGCGNDSGNYVLGAYNKMQDNGYYGALALYVDKNGEFTEKRFECANSKFGFCQGICLEDGNALVVGMKGGTWSDHVADTMWIAVMTPELEIVEEHFCTIETPFRTWTGEVYLDFNSEGDVVILAGASRYVDPYLMTMGVYVVLKCDVHGNVLDIRYFSEGHAHGGARPTDIVRVPGTDKMMMLGKGFNLNGYHTITYLDNDLELAGTYPLPWLESIWNHTKYWKDNGNFLMSSMTHHFNMLQNPYYTAVFEVDDTGHYLDSLVYDRADTSDYTAQYGSMAYFSDKVIYWTTYWENGDNENPNDAVICLIDSDLNLLGVKRLIHDNMKVRMLHCQVTGDGGCLFYGGAKISYGDEMVVIWKLMPDDFIVPWTMTDESEVSLHNCVYPNPTADYINITLGNIESDFRVVVRDLEGRKCFERRFEKGGGRLTLDVSAFENGTYVYEVVTGGKSTMKGKFVKN